MVVFEKAEWIWQNCGDNVDEYVEFAFDVKIDADKKTVIKIASDSNYNVFIDGKIACFGQYADYPEYKVYDTVDITKFVKDGSKISVLVWSYGIQTQTYIKDGGGVIFEVLNGDEIVAFSSDKTLCRIYDLYENGYNKIISVQLGQSFKYYGNKTPSKSFANAVYVDKGRNFYSRPNEKLVLGDRAAVTVKDLGDGYLIDLGQETVRFIDLDFESSAEQTIVIGYGEYLFDGQVRYKNPANSGMNHSIEYVAKTGDNKYVNYFRRIAGRYLQFFCKEPVKINYIGLIPVNYPVNVLPYGFKSEMRNKIYETAVRTLRLCMHEHFEDCPWREQALYNMDARNEMLCSYYAFGDYKFARADLVLMSKGLRKDNLLSLCFPAGMDFPIPFFSLCYPVQLFEYVRESGDVTVLDETFDTASAIINNFIGRIEENGLIDRFEYPYWNFYEWSVGSSGFIPRTPAEAPDKYNAYDLILNCMFLYSVMHYARLCEIKGKKFNFDIEKTLKSIRKTFYDEEKGMYKATTEGAPFYTVLGNSLAILVGLGDETLADKIVDGKDMVGITLSMNTWLYEALLQVNGDKYKNYILNDIDKKYSTMIKKGATTFWETELGAFDMGESGSLCHGWSALPIYYYRLLNQLNYFDGEL